MLKKMNVKYVDIKDVHLPLTSTPDEIKTARKEFEDAGLIIEGGGNITFSGRGNTSNQVFVDWMTSAPEAHGYLSASSDIVGLLVFDRLLFPSVQLGEAVGHRLFQRLF